MSAHGPSYVADEGSDIQAKVHQKERAIRMVMIHSGSSFWYLFCSLLIIAWKTRGKSADSVKGRTSESCHNYGLWINIPRGSFFLLMFP